VPRRRASASRTGPQRSPATSKVCRRPGATGCCPHTRHQAIHAISPRSMNPVRTSVLNIFKWPRSHSFQVSKGKNHLYPSDLKWGLGRKVTGIGISQGRPGGSGCLALTASATENPPEGARSTVIEVEVTTRIATRIIRTCHVYPSPSFW
jgi:hypothetical protein